MNQKKIAILGCGNIGSAIAEGLTKSKKFYNKNITLTRRNLKKLANLKINNYNITSDNIDAIQNSEIIIFAVEPKHLLKLLKTVKKAFNDSHIIISVVTGIEISAIHNIINSKIPVVRAMPNTAISIQESMTCLSSENNDALKIAEDIFDTVGQTHIISEEQMVPATALGACGIAFFLRAIRSASQGGIEIGFNSESSYKIAAQTAKGASALLLQSKKHPEEEIDRVTTPRGCTIAGLNEMEHKGFSSAMIKGIVTSSEKAKQLIKPK